MKNYKLEKERKQMRITFLRIKLFDFLNTACSTVEVEENYIASIKKEADRLYNEAGLERMPFLDKVKAYKSYFG